MTSNAENLVPLALNGARITSGFRSALFDAAARRGISVNELVLRAAARKLHESGSEFSGIFQPGDMPEAVEDF